VNLVYAFLVTGYFEMVYYKNFAYCAVIPFDDWVQFYCWYPWYHHSDSENSFVGDKFVYCDKAWNMKDRLFCVNRSSFLLKLELIYNSLLILMNINISKKLAVIPNALLKYAPMLSVSITISFTARDTCWLFTSALSLLRGSSCNSNSVVSL